MKNLRSFCSRHGKKVLAVLGSVLVLMSCMILPTFADDTWQSVAPIDFMDYNGALTVTAFPGSHSLPLVDGVTIYRDYLSRDDYNNDQGTRVLYGDIYGNGSIVPYIQIYVVCNYQAIYVNSETYSGQSTAALAAQNPINLYVIDHFISYPVSGSYGNTTHFYFNIGLGVRGDYEGGYQAGYEQGKVDGYNEGYNAGLQEDPSYNEAYQQGYNDASANIDSGEWGVNLLGDTLSAPIRALNQFTLVTTPSGFDITLGHIVGSVLTLLLVFAFIRLFRGA